MLNLLYARAGQDIRGELLERMGRSAARRRLLIVPEQYSHETERALCAVGGPQASLYAEVLSFSRLANRVFQAAGGLGEEELDGAGGPVRLCGLLLAGARPGAGTGALFPAGGQREGQAQGQCDRKQLFHFYRFLSFRILTLPWGR